jgi:3-oxoacyl-[acyl-carrier protein] reductase
MGITINALAPAVVQTAMVEAMPTAQVKYMTDKIPMKRCGTLEEVADLALFIVSPKNSFTTGFTFDLSGGRATY